MLHLHRANRPQTCEFALLSRAALESGVMDEVAGAPTDTIYRDFANPYLETVRLLREAADIEHALMVQYLYAAFSVRDRYAGIVGVASGSGDGILTVAVQEMEHLDAVNRTLVMLGAAPNLTSQEFPYETDLYPFPMDLTRLTRDSLAKY